MSKREETGVIKRKCGPSTYNEKQNMPSAPAAKKANRDCQPHQKRKRKWKDEPQGKGSQKNE